MPLVNFSGIASGIDTQGLIKATSDATRQARVTPNKDKIRDFEETNEALTKLKTQLNEFRTQALAFSTVEGGGTETKVFSSDEVVASAQTSANAPNGTHTINVSRRAATGSFSFNDRFAATTSVVAPTLNGAASAADRTVTVTVGTGAAQVSVPLVLTPTTTISDLVNSFNTQTSKARAALVNVGTAAAPSYALSINTLAPGTENGQIGVTVGAEITAQSVFTAQTLNQAQNAEFTLTGIAGTFSRSSNSISDVIPGLTIDLQGVGTATLTVETDREATKDKVRELVNKYNEIVKYVNENNTVVREENGTEVSNIFGSLARATIDTEALRAVTNVFSSTVSASGTSIKIFADLGITTERDGTLKFSEDVFDKAMEADSTAVGEILTAFANTVATTGGVISQYTRFNGLMDITLNSQREQVKQLNDKIAEAEKFITSTEANLMRRFARLEATMGRMQGQQQALSGALASLGGGR